MRRRDIASLPGVLARKVMGARDQVTRGLSSACVSAAAKAGLGRRVTVGVSDLIAMNTDACELVRLDVVVRWLAIGQMRGENDCGMALYRKMQDARMGEGFSDGAVERFERLVGSYDEGGFDEDSRVLLDSRLQLVDGSHRLALALHEGLLSLPAVIVPGHREVEYSIDWFLAQGFTGEEVDLIADASREVARSCRDTLTAVVWQPAVTMADEILSDLSRYGKIAGSKAYELAGAYPNVVRALYAVDDIESWKVDRKVEHMGPGAGELVCARVRVPDPRFRVKRRSGLPISRTAERAKGAIRARYRDEVDEYYFDNVLHIADNFLQSDYMDSVLEPGFDARWIIGALDPFEYALTKVDVPFYPTDFPDSIPVGKDVDVLCTRHDLRPATKALLDAWRRLGIERYEVRTVEGPNRFKMRIELLGHLILQVDVSSAPPEGTRGPFLDEALGARERRGSYWVLSPRHECLHRVAAYSMDRAKQYHKAYVLSHQEDYKQVDARRLLKEACVRVWLEELRSE